ncbi:hypothetical protein BT63DRAFT_316115 [Microthyrium microscopicum]|uniref:Uncharacterized protein n=1 Tax=Microthyrium microscopicum TaxID=703497 RepID=A0A6A6U3J1_9PEZI|nr:hypothetical protein BT63DRAFT_316115 [Microthyrium microscopicum]
MQSDPHDLVDVGLHGKCGMTAGRYDMFGRPEFVQGGQWMLCVLRRGVSTWVIVVDIKLGHGTQSLEEDHPAIISLQATVVNNHHDSPNLNMRLALIVSLFPAGLLASITIANNCPFGTFDQSVRAGGGIDGSGYIGPQGTYNEDKLDAGRAIKLTPNKFGGPPNWSQILNIGYTVSGPGTFLSISNVPRDSAPFAPGKITVHGQNCDLEWPAGRDPGGIDVVACAPGPILVTLCA